MKYLEKIYEDARQEITSHFLDTKMFPDDLIQEIKKDLESYDYDNNKELD